MNATPTIFVKSAAHGIDNRVLSTDIDVEPGLAIREDSMEEYILPILSV